MLLLAILLATTSALQTFPFEINSNKPFVPVTVNGSAPQWFILDSGCSGTSIVARECADRLKLDRGQEARADVGAGSGADVRLAVGSDVVMLGALGETLSVASPRVLTLGHVDKVEGRRVDGLLGEDFLSRHVVEIDYARSTITLHDPAGYEPPAKAAVVPLNLETGWPIAEGTVKGKNGTTLPCRLIIDTGVRGTVNLFRPFAMKHGLHESNGILRGAVIGGGAGGLTRGDVGRLDVLTIGPARFTRPVAIFSRDTSGVFALEEPEGIVGGELLKRHRVTFDYPHRRMILEPNAEQPAFEYDMSGLFLATDAPDHMKIRILSVNSGTPAAEAGLRAEDEIVSIDGRGRPELTLDDVRALFRVPATRQLEIRRAGKILKVALKTRRLV